MTTLQDNQPEIIMCEACGSAMYLFEMVQCECGRLVHGGCVTDGECCICANANPIDNLLEYITLAVPLH